MKKRRAGTESGIGMNREEKTQIFQILQCLENFRIYKIF